MKKIYFVIAFLLFFTLHSIAQPCTIAITNLPCMAAPGVNGVASVTPCPGAYYQWQTATGHVNSIWFNGSPGPVQTSAPSVNFSFNLAQQFYVVCVTAYTPTDTSNTVCDTIWGYMNDPVFASTNSTIGVPGDSGIYNLEPFTAGCPSNYIWFLTGDVTFNNGSQSYTGPGNPGAGVNLNFGPNFTTGVLCVLAVTNFGLQTDTVCMTITAPVGINDISNPHISFYYQPGPDQITLEFSEVLNQHISIKIYDITGRQVMEHSTQTLNNNQQLIIPTPALKQGTYLVEVTGADFRKVFKFGVID